MHSLDVEPKPTVKIDEAPKTIIGRVIFFLFLFFFLFFFPQKTPSISYKILQMRVLYTNPCREAIVPFYVDAH